MVENLKVQLVRPAVVVRARTGPAREGALAVVCHVPSDRVSHFPGSICKFVTPARHRLTLRVTLCLRGCRRHHCSALIWIKNEPGGCSGPDSHRRERPAFPAYCFSSAASELAQQTLKPVYD
jgi:hypothetical protein